MANFLYSNNGSRGPDMLPGQQNHSHTLGVAVRSAVARPVRRRERLRLSTKPSIAINVCSHRLDFVFNPLPPAQFRVCTVIVTMLLSGVFTPLEMVSLFCTDHLLQ